MLNGVCAFLVFHSNISFVFFSAFFSSNKSFIGSGWIHIHSHNLTSTNQPSNQPTNWNRSPCGRSTYIKRNERKTASKQERQKNPRVLSTFQQVENCRSVKQKFFIFISSRLLFPMKISSELEYRNAKLLNMHTKKHTKTKIHRPSMCGMFV